MHKTVCEANLAQGTVLCRQCSRLVCSRGHSAGESNQKEAHGNVRFLKRSLLRTLATDPWLRGVGCTLAESSVHLLKTQNLFRKDDWEERGV